MFLPRAQARSSYASVVSAVVNLSVCLGLSVRHTSAHCFVTKPNNALRMIPHERAITLVFWHQQYVVGGRRPFPLKFALKVTHPLKSPSSRGLSAITERLVIHGRINLHLYTLYANIFVVYLSWCTFAHDLAPCILIKCLRLWSRVVFTCLV